MAFYLLAPCLGHAEITPSEVIVIANSNLPASVQIAKHYLEARGVPKGNLIPLSLPTSETISRESYINDLVLELRKKLIGKNLAAKAKVILSVFGVPLKVAAPEASDEEKQITFDAIVKQKVARIALTDALKVLRETAAKSSVNSSPAKGDEPANDQQIAEQIFAEIPLTADRIASNISDESRRNTERQELTKLVLKVGGHRALLNILKPDPNSAEFKTATAQLDQLRLEVSTAEEMLVVLNQSPSALNRSRAYLLSERLYGTLGVLSRANAEIAGTKQESADASVDSELTLLWFPQDAYPLRGRLPNPLYYEQQSTSTSGALPHISLLMTSRIDAPTAELAQQVINNSLNAERQGLSGQVYIDARGLKLKNDDIFSVWDQNLRDLGWMIRDETEYKVHIDNFDPLIDDAPTTAIYVGWYQLRKYNDVFSYQPGSIGYHIASEEAVSIKEANETGWCKNMLQKGITVTLGAVAEPYLDSFPLPTTFLGLLLTGKYSLVEAYFLSTKYVSWRMVLFGDPLYNPWRADRAIKLTSDDIKLTKPKNVDNSDLPQAPGSLPFPDPAKLSARLVQESVDSRQQQNVRIEKYFANFENHPRPVTIPSPTDRSTK